jgi:hypothetical protein
MGIQIINKNKMGLYLKLGTDRNQQSCVHRSWPLT